MKDEIITALWKIKDEISREHGSDVRRQAASVRRIEREQPERVVDWSRRTELAGRFDYDLRAITADLRKHEQEHPERLVTFPPKPARRRTTA